MIGKFFYNIEVYLIYLVIKGVVYVIIVFNDSFVFKSIS